MRISKQHTQKGFIALFFALSISSVLLVYVTAGSTSVFDFIHTRRSFVEHRERVQKDLMCGDAFVDYIIRNYRYGVFSSQHTIIFQAYTCSVQHVLVQILPENIHFSFISGSVRVVGDIEKGFITNLETEYVSL